MKKTLKINGIPILNFIDLRRQFDPLDIYNHLDQFCEFADVHCLSLPTHLVDEETGKKYEALCITKDFWFMLIRNAGTFFNLSCGNPLSQFVENEITAAHENDDDNYYSYGSEPFDSDVLKKELRCSDIDNKFEYIMQAVGEQAGQQKVLLLLAICEISEIDPRQIDESLWKYSEKCSNQYSEEIGPEISDFPYDDEVYLTAGTYAYKYWYHDKDSLEEGQRIKTVRVIAKGSTNEYAPVRIELYSSESKALIQEVSLRKGEFRYCNVSAGKIIKFLPVISISDDVCLLREKLNSSSITIQTRNAESWTLNIDHVSTFSCGSASQGFILLQNGEVYSQFYKPAEEYFNKLRLAMIPMSVVEVIIRENNYYFLLEDGSVFSNANNSGNRIVSLDKTNRYPFPYVESYDFDEIVLSESYKSFAGVNLESGKNMVLFAEDRHIEASVSDNRINIRLL